MHGLNRQYTAIGASVAEETQLELLFDRLDKAGEPAVRLDDQLGHPNQPVVEYQYMGQVAGDSGSGQSRRGQGRGAKGTVGAKAALQPLVQLVVEDPQHQIDLGPLPESGQRDLDI